MKDSLMTGVDVWFFPTNADSSTGNQRISVVDEQDDVAAGVDLLEHLLQALFEVTAVAACLPPVNRGPGCRAACP